MSSDVQEKVEAKIKELGFVHAVADCYTWGKDDDLELCFFRQDGFVKLTTYGIDGVEVKSKEQSYSFEEFLTLLVVRAEEKTFALY